MRIHYIQHVPFENLGHIDDWLQHKQYIVTKTQLWEAGTLPAVFDYDGLIILGGPMNVDEEETYPWLRPEKNFIAEAVRSNKKILGICLGAQLLAAVLKADITQNHHKEIGWFPIGFNNTFKDWLGKETTLQQNVFHWHGDTFSIPSGAVNHASSEGCANQLFTLGASIIGIQFHLEITPALLQAMVQNEGHELTKDQYIQPAEELENETSYYAASHDLLDEILEKIF